MRGSASERSGEETNRGDPAGPRGSTQEPGQSEPRAADSGAHAWASQRQRTQQLSSSLKCALACLQPCNASTAHAAASSLPFHLPAPLRRSLSLCEADACAYSPRAIVNPWPWCRGQCACLRPPVSPLSWFRPQWPPTIAPTLSVL